MRLWSGCEGLWGNWTRSACSQDQAGVLCHNKGRREGERQRRERGERETEGGRGLTAELLSGPKTIGGELAPLSLCVLQKTAWRRRSTRRRRGRRSGGKRKKGRAQREKRRREKKSLSLRLWAVIRLAATLTVTSGNDRSGVELSRDRCTQTLFLPLSHSACHSSSFSLHSECPQEKTHSHSHFCLICSHGHLPPSDLLLCFNPIPQILIRSVAFMDHWVYWSSLAKKQRRSTSGLCGRQRELILLSTWS